MIDWEKSIKQVEEERADLDMRRSLLNRVRQMQDEAEHLHKEIDMLKGKSFTSTLIAEDAGTRDEEREYRRKEAKAADEKCAELEKRLAAITAELAEYEAASNAVKSFNKYVCFSNIRELLRQKPDVKLGQIEKDAGCQPGYMSRLEKANSTGEPSIEFVVTASKALGVGLDTLLTVDLVQLTPTENYLVSLIQKLISDTVADKLYWNKESAEYLMRQETDINGNVDHPLFNYETFYEEGETEYPDEVSRVVFASNAFDVHTAIAGDCFNIRLKNGATVYLMDISKSVYHMNDPNAFVKEIWIYTPGVGSSFLVDNRSIGSISALVNSLFAAVSERMKHPRIRKEHLYALDAFMKDDLDDDPVDDTLPF